MGGNTSKALSKTLPAAHADFAKADDFAINRQSVPDFAAHCALAYYVLKNGSFHDTEQTCASLSDIELTPNVCSGPPDEAYSEVDGLQAFHCATDGADVFQYGGVFVWRIARTVYGYTTRIAAGKKNCWVCLIQGEKVLLVRLLSTVLHADNKESLAQGIIRSGMLKYCSISGRFVLGAPVSEMSSDPTLVGSFMTEITPRGAVRAGAGSHSDPVPAPAGAEASPSAEPEPAVRDEAGFASAFSVAGTEI